MNYLKITDSDALQPFIISTGLLLILLAFLVPFPAILFIQDMLFFSYDHLSFVRPPSSYVSFGIGMIWIALVMFSFLITKIYAENKERTYKLTGLHLIFVLLGLVTFVLAIYQYHYLDDYGIHSNTFWTFSEESMAWENVEEISRLVDEKNYEVLSYTFSNKTKQITIPYDSQDTDTSRAIYAAIDTYEWDLIDHFTK